MKPHSLKPRLCAIACSALLTLGRVASADPPVAGPPQPGPTPAPDAAKLAAVGSQAHGNEINDAQRNAVQAGLQYLAGEQQSDGSFGAGGEYGAAAAITSLCGLAFMADGNLPDRGKYGEQVRKAVDFITRNQQESGLFTAVNAGGEMYSHGFATLFIGEVYGMTGDDEVKENLKKAVRLIIRSQNPQGGWRYSPAPIDADISVTICQIMALRAARDAGIEVEGGVIDHAVQYVRSCQNSDGGFSYMINGGDSGFARTAAGTASLYYAGIFQDNAVTRGLDYMARFAPTINSQGALTDEEGHFFYGHYYAAQAMFLAGGKYWDDWYPAIRDCLVSRQQKDGSWQGEVHQDYCTAMALIILQMPHRYLPVFNGKGPGS